MKETPVLDSTILPVPARSVAPKAGGHPPPPIARNVPEFADLLAHILGQTSAVEPRRPEPASRSDGDRPVRPADRGVEEDERREPVERPEDDEAPARRPEASESRDDPVRGERPSERPDQVERTEARSEAKVEKAEARDEAKGQGDAPAEEEDAAPVEVGQKGEANPVARGPFGPAPVVPALEVLSKLFPEATAAPAGVAEKGPVLPLPKPAGESQGDEAPVETPAAPAEAPAEPTATTADATEVLPTEVEAEAAPVEAPEPAPEAPKPEPKAEEAAILFETEEGESKEESQASRTFSTRAQGPSQAAKPGTQTVEGQESTGRARPEADPRNVHPNPAVQALARANANAVFQREAALGAPPSTTSTEASQGSSNPSQPVSPVERASGATPATPATPARSEAPAGNPQIETIERIVRMAKVTRVGERSTARVWLNPPDLGTVRVTVTVDRGVVTANLSVETTAAREALLADLPQLTQQLESSGMKLGSLDVGFFGADSGRQPEKKAEKESSDRGRGRGADDRTSGGASRRGDSDGEVAVESVGHIGFDSVDLFA